MPTLQQAQQLKEFAEEIFQISQRVWATESKAKGGARPELSQTEFLTLDLLAKNQPQTVGDLQRQIGVLPAQMSRVIRALEAKSDGPLISCSINSRDKRRIDVELTPAGADARQAYREVKLSSIKILLEGLTEKDREELMRILRLMHNKARKFLSGK